MPIVQMNQRLEDTLYARLNGRFDDIEGQYDAIEALAEETAATLADRVRISDLASADGSAGVGVDRSTGRTLEDIIRSSVAFNPEDFGADPTGVTSSTFAFTACIAAAAGRPIVLTSGARYLLTTVVNITTDIDLNLNGATIDIRQDGFFVRNRKSRTMGITGLATVQGQRQITIPSGVTIVKGDWLILNSDTVRNTPGNYLYGEAVEVVAVAGGIAYLGQALLYSYAVNTIDVYGIERAHIRGGTIDHQNCEMQTAGAIPYRAVITYAKDVRCDLRLLGGDLSGAGVSAIGMSVDIGGYAQGFLNTQSYNSGSVGGRLGYGFAGSGRKVRMFGEARDCKHGFTSADRTFVTEYVLGDVPIGSTPIGTQAETISDGGGTGTKYQGIFDLHSNVEEAEIRGGRFSGVNSLIMFRNKRLTVRGTQMISYGVVTTQRQNGLIYCSEELNQTLVLRDIDASSPTSGTTIPSALVHAVTDFGNQIISVDADNIRLQNTPIFNHSSGNSGSSTNNFGRLTFTKVTGYGPYGIRVGGNGSGAVIGSIGSLTFDGRFQVNSPNFALGPGIIVEHFTSLGTYIASGIIDAMLLTTTNMAGMQIGRTSTAQPSTGSIGEIIINAEVRAGLIAIDIATSSTTPVSKVAMDGAKAYYNYANQTSGVAGFKFQYGVNPSSKETFNGAIAFNSGSSVGAGSTPAVLWSGGFANDDLSGIAINDIVTPANKGYQPLGLRLIGQTEVPWRSPTLYINAIGQIISDAAPTLTVGQGAFKSMRSIMRNPVVGSPRSWIFSGTAWVSEGNLTTVPGELDKFDSTALNSAAHAVNTSNKSQGRPVFNTTVGKPVYAQGSGATAVWNDGAGTLVNTPV